MYVRPAPLAMPGFYRSRMANLEALLHVPKLGALIFNIDSMRVISRKPLVALSKRYPTLKDELNAWFHEVESARWATPADLKRQYGNASILKAGRVVFNICGNKFHIVTKINYDYSIVYIRFAGTHRECDSIDADDI